MADSNQHTQ